MATAVESAFTSGGCLLVEGPCGIGKSYAYLVPMIYTLHHPPPALYQRSEVRKKKGEKNFKLHGVVATANIALQAQLVGKDLPALAKILPWPFTFALYKGRSNYLCRNRFGSAAIHGKRGFFSHLPLSEQQEIERVMAWGSETSSGDLADLIPATLPEVWDRFSRSADECLRETCAERKKCFAEQKRIAAMYADVIVTNYHLLFAHAAHGAVLPNPDLLVLDEAHEAADIARGFLGFEMHGGSFRRLALRARSHKDLRDLADQVEGDAGAFFARLHTYARSPLYEIRLKKPRYVDGSPLLDSLAALLGEAEQLKREDSWLFPDDKATVDYTLRRAGQLRSNLIRGLELKDDLVYYIDIDKKDRASLCSKAVDTSAFVKSTLGRSWGSVLTSATLLVEDSFDYIQRETGTRAAKCLTVKSPFDFERRVLLLCTYGLGTDLPADPADDSFVEAAADAIRSFVEVCNGRTLCLFTSWKNLHAVRQALDKSLPYTLLCQGDFSREELSKRFREDISSVLLGTESFWMGIDVPGEALTGLVIDRLPFPNLKDPLIDALRERNPRSFDEIFIPRAVTMLRQGIGRLIRNKSDYGAVLILDQRIWHKKYGRRFLSSLPPMLQVLSLADVASFLKERSGMKLERIQASPHGASGAVGVQVLD